MNWISHCFFLLSVNIPSVSSLNAALPERFRRRLSADSANSAWGVPAAGTRGKQSPILGRTTFDFRRPAPAVGCRKSENDNPGGSPLSLAERRSTADFRRPAPKVGCRKSESGRFHRGGARRKGPSFAVRPGPWKSPIEKREGRACRHTHPASLPSRSSELSRFRAIDGLQRSKSVGA